MSEHTRPRLTLVRIRGAGASASRPGYSAHMVLSFVLTRPSTITFTTPYNPISIMSSSPPPSSTPPTVSDPALAKYKAEIIELAGGPLDPKDVDDPASQRGNMGHIHWSVCLADVPLLLI